MSNFRIEASRAVEPYFYYAPYPKHKVKPRLFQMAAAEFALARDHCLIGDAPGVGKTGECLLVDNAIKAKHTLVVCPASLRYNWEREIRMWSTHERPSVYVITKKIDGVSPEANFNIISYDLLRNEATQRTILRDLWDHVIMDEVHYIKDPNKNARVKFLCQEPEGLKSRAGRLTVASGTILPNRPDECYNIARLLDWSCIDHMSLEAFRAHYYDYGEGWIFGKVWDEERQANIYKRHWSKEVRNVPQNLLELQNRLREYIMIRRLKEQVLHELPAKQWHLMPLDTSPAMRKALKHPGWSEAEKLYELDPDAFEHGIPVDGYISTARRELGEAKAPAVARYVEDLLREVDKVVIAAWHHSVLDYLRERLAKHGLVYMDGSTSTRKKQNAVDAFQDRDDVRIILGQTKVMGLGWTMTAAQDVIFAEPDWVPGVMDQMLDRVHRFGQEKDYVVGHLPVVPGTIDEKIMNAIVRKQQNIHLALDYQS